MKQVIVSAQQGDWLKELCADFIF